MQQLRCLNGSIMLRLYIKLRPQAKIASNIIYVGIYRAIPYVGYRLFGAYVASILNPYMTPYGYPVWVPYWIYIWSHMGIPYGLHIESINYPILVSHMASTLNPYIIPYEIPICLPYTFWVQSHMDPIWTNHMDYIWRTIWGPYRFHLSMLSGIKRGCIHL